MDKGNIAGIFNYCDRWCERCTFTSRCAVFEDETDLPPEERDLTNKAFWESLGKNFAKAQHLLQRAAEQGNVDLAAMQEELEESLQRKEQIKLESHGHPLSILSLEYSEAGRQWLKTQPGMLDRLDTLKAGLTLGIESREGARKETGTIKDSLSVIQWYLFFIHVKLVRALMAKKSSAAWDVEEDDQHDYDGSAKVALLAIERSMHAWSSLFEILPENEDDFLNLLSMLDKIRRMLKEEFPGAPAFIRPGFDEV